MSALARRYSPFAELSERFDRMFEDFFDRGVATHTPAIDVIDEDDALVLRAEIPGMSPDEVTVQLENDVLTIRGQHEETSEEKNKRYLRRERRVGAFARSIAVPPGTDPDAVEASCKNGVLEVRLPHAARPQPKTIEVKTTD